MPKRKKTNVQPSETGIQNPTPPPPNSYLAAASKSRAPAKKDPPSQPFNPKSTTPLGFKLPHEVILALTQAITSDYPLRCRMFIHSAGKDAKSNICNLSSLVTIEAVLALGIDPSTVKGFTPNYGLGRVTIFLTLPLEDIKSTITHRKLEIQGKAYPISFHSTDYIQVDVVGFAPKPAKELEKLCNTIFSSFADVLSVHVPTVRDIPSTRLTVVFKRVSHHLANVTAILIGEHQFTIIWPRHLAPPPEKARAMDLTPEFPGVYVSLAQVPSLLRERRLGIDPRHPNKPKPQNKPDTFYTTKPIEAPTPLLPNTPQPSKPLTSLIPPPKPSPKPAPSAFVGATIEGSPKGPPIPDTSFVSQKGKGILIETPQASQGQVAALREVFQKSPTPKTPTSLVADSVIPIGTTEAVNDLPVPIGETLMVPPISDSFTPPPIIQSPVVTDTTTSITTTTHSNAPLPLAKKEDLKSSFSPGFLLSKGEKTPQPLTTRTPSKKEKMSDYFANLGNIPKSPPPPPYDPNAISPRIKTIHEHDEYPFGGYEPDTIVVGNSDDDE